MTSQIYLLSGMLIRMHAQQSVKDCGMSMHLCVCFRIINKNLGDAKESLSMLLFELAAN